MKDDGTRGEIVPEIAGIGALLILAFFCGFQFIRSNVISMGVRDAMRSAAIVSVTQNYHNAYASIREGLPGAYAIDDSGAAHDNSENDLQQRLCKTLGLQARNGSFTRTEAGESAYSLSGINVEIDNPPVGENGAYKVTAKSTLSVTMPLSLPPIQVPLTVYADFRPKF